MNDSEFKKKLEKFLPELFSKLEKEGRIVIEENKLTIKPSMCKPTKIYGVNFW